MSKMFVYVSPTVEIPVVFDHTSVGRIAVLTVGARCPGPNDAVWVLVREGGVPGTEVLVGGGYACTLERGEEEFGPIWSHEGLKELGLSPEQLRAVEDEPKSLLLGMYQILNPKLWVAASAAGGPLAGPLQVPRGQMNPHDKHSLFGKHPLGFSAIVKTGKYYGPLQAALPLVPSAR